MIEKVGWIVKHKRDGEYIRYDYSDCIYYHKADIFSADVFRNEEELKEISTNDPELPLTDYVAEYVTFTAHVSASREF